MKTVAAFLCVIWFSMSSLASGITIGNGGNGIICKKQSGEIQSVELLDYYELRLKGGVLPVYPILETYAEILGDIFNRWQAVAPKRMALYKKWLKEFSSEMGMYSNVIIPTIPDTGVIVIPDGCVLRPIAFQRPDGEVLPGVKRYTIDKNIWDLMPEFQRAGLVLHELIYREGIQLKHQSSFPTRYFNGYLSSEKPDPKAYRVLASRLSLPWVEYGNNLVVTLFASKCKSERDPDDCVIYRVSEILDDGRQIKIVASNWSESNVEISGDIETEFLKISFDQKIRVHGFFEVTDDHFYIAIQRGALPISKISYRDLLNLNFIRYEKQRMDYNYTFKNFLNIDTAQTVPQVSWLKIDNVLLDGLVSIQDYALEKNDGTRWVYDRYEERYRHVVPK